MTGAMAGSTATLYNEVSGALRVLTLTINNRCNLSCPHCYLQYGGDRSCISQDLISTVLASDFAHLAIVGKEPLVDAQSARICEQLIFGCAASGKGVSLTTNGLGLERLQPEAYASVSWIDISLDGGPATYQRYRKGDYRRVLDQARWALRCGLKSVNALHTLSDGNLANVDDMMAVWGDLAWNKIIFSPFARVRNEGRVLVAPVPLADLLNALRRCPRFMECEMAIILLGANAFEDQGFQRTQVAEQIATLGLSHKVVQVQHDPLDLGYLRLTYDGYVMTPYQSLHPADYRHFGVPVGSFEGLEEAFASLALVAP